MDDDSKPETPPPVDTTGLEQLPSGRWRPRVRDPERPGQHMPSPSFPTVEEAARMRRGTLALLANQGADGTLPDPDSLQRFGDAWLVERELAGDSRSIATFKSQWTHVTGTPLATMALARITAVEVRAWLDKLTQKKALVAIAGGEAKHAPSKRTLSRSTASKVLSMLRQVFERAVEKGLITTNPARDVRVRKNSHARVDDVWTYLTLAEIKRLEACTDIPENYRLVYLIAIYTGLREGELWGLHWRDVTLDGDRPQLVVRYSRRGPPKNNHVRHVPLLRPAQLLLVRWKAIAPASEEGLTFPTRTGEMRSKGDDARWADYHAPKMVEGVRKNVRCPGQSKKLNLGRPARFHDLRHTCASHLIMGSWGVQWSLSEIAAYLGHSDTEVTERYAHLSPDHLHSKASKTALRGTELPYHEAPANTQKQLARPRGLEPLTSRSVAPGEPECFRGGTPLRGTAVVRAREVLHAAAQGQLAEEAIQALVQAVLSQEHVALALSIGHPSGDPLRVRRALQLAVAVVSCATALCVSADSADSADSEAENA